MEIADLKKRIQSANYIKFVMVPAILLWSLPHYYRVMIVADPHSGVFAELSAWASASIFDFSHIFCVAKAFRMWKSRSSVGLAEVFVIAVASFTTAVSGYFQSIYFTQTDVLNAKIVSSVLFPVYLVLFVWLSLDWTPDQKGRPAPAPLLGKKSREEKKLARIRRSILGEETAPEPEPEIASYDAIISWAPGKVCPICGLNHWDTKKSYIGHFRAEDHRDIVKKARERKND